MSARDVPGMKPVLEAVLFLVWVAAYLAAVSWVVRYRRSRGHVRGPIRLAGYRTDMDLVLRLAILVLGFAMLLVGYFATSMLGQYF